MMNCVKKIMPWLLLLPALVSAQELYVDGTHYTSLSQAVPTTTGDKVEVVEVFWYGCPHCFSLEPLVDKWLENKPENAAFVRVPTTLGRKQWEAATRSYFVAAQLGVQESMHKAMMEAVHVKKRNMTSKEAVKALFVEHGVDGDAFDKAYASFDVETQMRRSLTLLRRYGIRSVPTLIINGKFKTSGSQAGHNMFDVVNFLVNKESGSS